MENKVIKTIRLLLSEIVDLLEADNNMEREVKLEILNKIGLISKLLDM